MSNDESEEALLVSPRSASHSKSIAASGGMPYTDGIQSPTSGNGLTNNVPSSSGPSASANSRTARAGSQQSHESETGELIEYNDEHIMSQFHADAIKQVRKFTDLRAN